MIDLNRRKFLKGIGATVGSLAAANILSPRFVLAEGNNGNSNLIMVNLRGGMDGLFAFPLIAPGVRDTLISLRGGIADINGIGGLGVDPATVIALNSEIGLHPKWAPIANLHTEGRLRLITKIGMPINPSFSHDVAQAYWQIGLRDPNGDTSGWLGRTMQYYDMPPIEAIGFRTGAATILRTSNRSGLFMNRLSSMAHLNRQNSLGGSGESQHTRTVANDLIGLRLAGTTAQASLKSAISSMYPAVVDVNRINAITLTGAYPQTSLGISFRDIAKCIKDRVQSGRTTNAFYVTTPDEGFDSHSSQLTTLPAQIDLMANSLAALVVDLKAIGAWNNTTICFFSEFGRTTRWNSGQSAEKPPGTDHGLASTMLICGGSVRGGANAVFGPSYTISDLQNKNWITPVIDYRNVFFEILAKMNFDPNAILTESFNRISLGLYL